MKRLDYLLAAFKANLHLKRIWVRTAFAVIQEAPDAWKKQPYAYRLVQSPTGVSFVDPNNLDELIPLEDCVPGQAPFGNNELVEVKAGMMVNLKEDITTSFGNLLANQVVLVFPFGAKIPYQNGVMMPSYLEELILPLYMDDPETTEEMEKLLSAKPNAIFTDEYLRYTNAISYLTGFADLFSSGGSIKNHLPPPGVKELRDALFVKYNIDLNNLDKVSPMVVAQIAAELKKLDAEWLKGDEALNFLIEKKSFDVVRAKKFLMLGAEAGLGDGQTVELIPNSLHEGWDINALPAMINNLRAGSFNRGAETMRGGVKFKELWRAASTVNIKPGDCGATLGMQVELNESNKKNYLGFTALVNSEAVQLTEEAIGSYLGKVVTMRSMQFCQLGYTDYCEVCAGPRLAASPTAAGSAVADYGSTMLLMFMKAVHGKALLLAKYKPELRIT